jgi:hypothetical protein
LSLGPVPDGYEKIDNPPIDVVDSPDLPPLTKVFGVRSLGKGVWEIPELTPELASPDAALHIGPQHIALEAAATETARAMSDGPLQITDWYVMFVNRGKFGPFRTRAEAFAGTDGRVGCRVDLLDLGEESRVVSSAAATFSRVG